MKTKEAIIKDLRNERQSAAVLRVIYKPMTPGEICKRALRFNENIRLKDIWQVMRSLERRGLTYRINPDRVTGRLYFLTDLGRNIVAAGFEVDVEPINPFVDWRKYGQVASAVSRKRVLLETGRATQGSTGRTATSIKRNLILRHPIGLNQAVETLKWLTKNGLVDCVGYRKKGKRNLKLYAPTKKGKFIIDEIQR